MEVNYIVMLSAHRCGSTAMFKAFQKHPDVKIINDNQKVENWEPNYWYWADRALAGDKADFHRKLKEAVPSIKVQRIDKQTIFDTWNKILNRFGPTAFDKSPIYLQSRGGMRLLDEYKNTTNNKIHFFAFIRDPRDAIVSQYRKWPGKTLKDWEREWLEKYEHLEFLQSKYKFKLYKYEMVAKNPEKFVVEIMNDCGLGCNENIYSHIKPIHVGRYMNDSDASKWKFSKRFIDHLKKYGYGE